MVRNRFRSAAPEVQMLETTANYGGSIPEYYDSCLGPAWFDAFGADLAGRLPPGPGDVLEIACGTGLVTRRLRARMPAAARLFATDISAAMLDYARGKLADCAGIEWGEADLGRLPFDGGRFAAVVCSFGVMFAADKPAAFREAHRVLAPGGLFLFNVWDRIDANPAAAVNGQVVQALFPGDPAVVLTTPYEMHDVDALRQLLDATGFSVQRLERKQIEVSSVSATTIAQGQVRGSPRSLLLQQRGASLDSVIEKVSAALAHLGGADPWRGSATAIVVEARALGVAGSSRR